MAALSASPSEDYASMIQSRKHCLALSAQALSPLQPLLPRKPKNDSIRCAMLSVAIWKRRAMPPTGLSGNTMPLTPRTGWWRVSLKRAGTGRSLTRRRSRARSPCMMRRTAPIADPASLGVLASNLKTVWDAPTTDARLKKRVVRTLVHEVVADIDDAASEIVLIVHWVGGAHSELRLPKRRRGQRNSTSADIIQAVRQLVLIASDDLIAGLLNRNGLKTGNGNRWTRERVTSMRSSYHIPVFKPADDGIEPWLNLGNAAKLLKIAPKTLRLAADAGEIEAFHPLSDGPWIFARASLTTTAAQSIAERARQNPRYPTGSHPNQQSLFSSTT